ncbi:restriction endonuclease [Nocardioides luteus]|uniref:restriction endonuclease n=1 Tax=Nocardioides luteus TaxID=1844 RepID=UPI0018C9BF19|nr:restriction endonuclease [Nocardioides luteus]MBG6094237.1 restriction system protein [Nocardioides luteus]
MTDVNPTELGIPQWWQFMYPLLQVTSDGSDWARRDLYPAVVERAGVPDDLRKLQHKSGKYIAEHRASWAKSGLVRARLLLAVRRGLFRITDAGREFLSAHPDGFTLADVKALPAWAEYEPERRQSSQSADAPGGERSSAERAPDELLDPVEQIEDGIARIEAEVAAELLMRLHANAPAFFEQAVLDLIVAMGYGGADGTATRTQLSNDNGIDGIVDQDALGLSRVYIQAKRYALDASVGRPDIQGFVGALHGAQANQGVFITTGRFSTGAKVYADSVATRVVLIDGARLARLMIRYGVGVQVKRTVHIVEIDEDFFE